MRVCVLCGVVGATLMLLPAGTGSDSLQAKPAAEQASEAPIVQADLLPGWRINSRPQSRFESDDPGEIEAEPATRSRPRNGGTPAKRTAKRSATRVVELTAPPAVTFDPVKQTNIAMGTDPQIALGEDFIVVTAAPTVVFFDKKSGNQLPEKPHSSGVSLPARMSATELFGPVRRRSAAARTILHRHRRNRCRSIGRHNRLDGACDRRFRSDQVKRAKERAERYRLAIGRVTP